MAMLYTKSWAVEETASSAPLAARVAPQLVQSCAGLVLVTGEYTSTRVCRVVLSVVARAKKSDEPPCAQSPWSVSVLEGYVYAAFVSQLREDTSRTPLPWRLMQTFPFAAVWTLTGVRPSRP